jgi:hypothetical protein
VHKFDSVSNTFVGFIVLPQSPVDARSTDNYLIITTRNSVYIYNNQMALVRQINSNQITNSNPLFSCATNNRFRFYWNKRKRIDCGCIV